MRWVFAVLAAASCSGKKEAAPQAGGSQVGSAVAVAADAAAPAGDAPPARVELLHAYAASIEVSSHVMNRTIKPEHLVDRDFNTAWNSKTGELVGAWLDVRVFGGAIDELRLTVGHTGKGPKGEDYFAMNPRITKLTVLDGDTPLVTATLDPDNRALQAIALPRAASQVRLRVDEVAMGTKKTWREVCISELEAWGTPPADAKPFARTPLVSVYVPPAPDPRQIVRGKPIDAAALCDEIMKPLQAEWDVKPHDIEDAPPHCGQLEGITVDALPWLGVGVWRLAYNEVHGPMVCNLLVTTTLGDFMVDEARGCGPWDGESLRPRSARAEDVMPGGDAELVIEYATTRDDQPVAMIVCRIANEAVQCTRSIEIEGPTWKVKPRFTKGTVVFDPLEGKPPAAVSGPHALVFDR